MSPLGILGCDDHRLVILRINVRTCDAYFSVNCVPTQLVEIRSCAGFVLVHAYAWACTRAGVCACECLFLCCACTRAGVVACGCGLTATCGGGSAGRPSTPRGQLRSVAGPGGRCRVELRSGGSPLQTRPRVRPISPAAATTANVASPDYPQISPATPFSDHLRAHFAHP